MPLNRSLLTLTALTHLLLGRREAADRCFSEILMRWPGSAFALAGRAHLRAQLGRQAEAIADARRLVQQHPDRSAADWFNLGFVLEADDRLAEAEPAFRRAVAMDPRLDRGWYGLGLVLIRQGRFDDAAAALQRTTELQPMSPYGWYQLARVQVDRQQPDEARQIIRHLRGFEPRVAAQLERETGLSP
ncbi:MAG TPA: tetratricopeptide repeat protein [Ideonella sp.]|nr:tetratricopeptide repeat protein [Ideonella sp.]